MSSIRIIVLDVLKPHKPILPDFANKLAEIPGIIGINISLIEIREEDSIDDVLISIYAS